MARIANTTPEAILLAMLGRLRSAIPNQVCNQSNSWLSALGRAPELPTSAGGTFHFEVGFAGFSFDKGSLVGGGREYLATNGTFDVTVFSTNRQGTPGRDDEFLTDADRGILPVAGLIVGALTILADPLVDGNGDRLLAEGLRPEGGGLGERTAEKGMLTITFHGRFNWNVGETFKSASGA